MSDYHETSYPALNHGVVTEGHARYCRENGHASNTINGVEQGTCPRCGDVTQPAKDQFKTETVQPSRTNFTQITPEDFSPYLHDGFRNKWTPEKIWWIMEAAKLKPSIRFIITTDKMTGHAEGNLTIEGIRMTPGYGTYQVLLKDHTNPDARWSRTWHSIDKIGAIVEVAPNYTDGKTKWDALDLQRTKQAQNPYFETYEGIRVDHRAQHERRMKAEREAEQARFNQVFG